MALILVAALAGVFGKGPASRRVARSPGGALELRYERMVRFQDQAVLKLAVNTRDLDDEGMVTITVGENYLWDHELKSVIPEPEEQRSQPGAVVFKFKPVRPGEPVTVQIRTKVEQLGTLRGSVTTSVGGVPEVLRFEQFALP